MNPKKLIIWALAISSVLLIACIGMCGIYQILVLTGTSCAVLLTPHAGEALVVLVVASLIATLVVGLWKVDVGIFQFSGLGMTFQGLACPATVWVLVFVSVSVAF